VWCTCKANVLHLDENVAALWVWINSIKSDDLRTNAFSTSKKLPDLGPRITEKNTVFSFVGHHCRDITRINVYFIFISESSPYVLSYWSMYCQVNAVGNFSNVLIEILFTNSWRQSFAILPIPKLSLYNNAAFLSSAKASQRFARKSNFLTYTLASLSYTLSVSEYVITNVKA